MEVQNVGNHNVHLLWEVHHKTQLYMTNDWIIQYNFEMENEKQKHEHNLWKMLKCTQTNSTESSRRYDQNNPSDAEHVLQKHVIARCYLK